jgi:hypothetical protein
VSTLARLLGNLFARIRKPIARPTHEFGAGNAARADALFRRCVQLADSAQFDSACNCYRRLLELDPRHSKACNNLGILHQRRGDLAAATQCFNDSARFDPGLAEPHVNLGNLMDIQGDPESAAHHYRQALEIDPGHAHAHCCLAQALLAMGRYESGWEEYEWRWRAGDPQFRLLPFQQPLWDGSQDIAGKRVLLHAEQGFGDAIQFIRYATLVAARGAKVIVICDAALRTLLQTVPGVESVVEPGRVLPGFAFHAPLMSLPRAFRTTVESIPAQVPYVFPDPAAVEAWRARLSGHAGRLKIGLAWAGRPSFVAASMKSCPLERLAAVLDTADCAFFSLQKGESAADLKKLDPRGAPVADYTDALHDFRDTAALIAALDIVISIDTAAAHLAGALGKPVWVLLAGVPDWRWLPRAGALKWYPTARLFRQHTAGEWGSVVAEVRQALQQAAARAKS